MLRLAQSLATHFARAIRQNLASLSAREPSGEATSLIQQNLESKEFNDALAQRMFAAMLELYQEGAIANRRVSAVEVVQRCRDVVETNVMHQVGLGSPSTFAADRKVLLDQVVGAAEQLGEQVAATFERLHGVTNKAIELLVTAEELNALPQ